MRQGGGRQKGNNFELKMARAFSVWWGQPDADKKLAKDLWFRRTPLSGGWASTITAGDIVTVSEEAKDFPFCPEFKKQECWDWSGWVNGNEGWPVWGFWKQCYTAADAMKKLPLLVFTKNHSPEYYCVVAPLAAKLGLKYFTSIDPTVNSHVFAFGLLKDLLAVPKDKVLAALA